MIRMKAEGGCLCGAIRYKVDGDVMGSAACHCRDCQYVCGGAPSYVFVVRGESLDVTQGEPASYRNTAESGAARIRHFCPKCGTPMFAENAAYPNVVSIKAGTLDDPSQFKVASHFWTSSAPPWHHIDPGETAFPKAPGDPRKDTD